MDTVNQTEIKNTKRIHRKKSIPEILKSASVVVEASNPLIDLQEPLSEDKSSVETPKAAAQSSKVDFQEPASEAKPASKPPESFKTSQKPASKDKSSAEVPKTALKKVDRIIRILENGPPLSANQIQKELYRIERRETAKPYLYMLLTKHPDVVWKHGAYSLAKKNPDWRKGPHRGPGRPPLSTSKATTVEKGTRKIDANCAIIVDKLFVILKELIVLESQTTEKTEIITTAFESIHATIRSLCRYTHKSRS